MGSALSVTPKNGIFHRKRGLVRNQVWIVPRYVPSRLLMLLRSMLIMSLMSGRSSASVNLPQKFRLTLPWPCFARMSLIKRMIAPVKTPA